jgi:biopolymer transport protein ExbB/TolQ
MQMNDYLLVSAVVINVVLLFAFVFVVVKLMRLQARLELMEAKFEILYESLQDLMERIRKIDDKIDIIKEIEQLVERIQVKREEDKDKVKQFLIKKFSHDMAG